MQRVVTAFYMIKAVKTGFSEDRKMIEADFMTQVEVEPDQAGFSRLEGDGWLLAVGIEKDMDMRLGWFSTA